MSGIEVAGLVLGALPVAVYGLKHYKSLVAPFKSVTIELQQLIRDIETEQLRLRATCEKLLEGTVPRYSACTIDQLVRDPFSKEWDCSKKQLQLRLWTSSEIFENTILEVDEAVQQLLKKLQINEEGLTSVQDRIGLLRQLKHRAAFSLKRREYQDIIDRIKSCNTTLDSLVSSACDLAPQRKRHSRLRFVRLFRQIGANLSAAISISDRCQDDSPHAAFLELIPREEYVLPDREGEAAEDIYFNTIFRFCEPGTQPNRFHRKTERVGPIPETQLKETKSPLSALTPPDTTGEGVQAGSRIIDLCKTFRGDPVPRINHCYGHIAALMATFSVNRNDFDYKVNHPITLRDLLEETCAARHEWSFLQRLQAALAIALGTVQLFNTPWIPEVLRLETFNFVRRPSSTDSLSRPFVASKKASDSEESSSRRSLSGRPINRTAVALGAVILQLIVGRPITELDEECMEDVNSVANVCQAGSRHMGQLLEVAGMNVWAVVQWCFKGAAKISGFSNEGFCQEFYSEVIARLEEDIETLEQHL